MMLLTIFQEYLFLMCTSVFVSIGRISQCHRKVRNVLGKEFSIQLNSTETWTEGQEKFSKLNINKNKRNKIA